MDKNSNDHEPKQKKYKLHLRERATVEKLTSNKILDQFYTKKSIIENVVVPCIKKYMPKGETFVDFSCGENILGCALSSYAGNILAYDLEPTKDAILSGAKVMDWFKVTNIPENSYVGLNPPFGYRGNLAQEFIRHTLKISHPLFMFLVLPIHHWQTPGFDEVEKIKLPLDSFILPNGENFSYPSHLYVFKQSLNDSIIKSNVPKYVLPSTFKLLTHPKDVDYNKTALLVRRVGFYAGRQFYFIVDKNVFYYHKSKLQINVTWENNKHNIDNSFWLVYFIIEDILVEQMMKIADGFIDYMNQNSITTRKEDTKRALSINKRQLSEMLIQNIPKKYISDFDTQN
jgi:predicted RNA methylase